MSALRARLAVLFPPLAPESASMLHMDMLRILASAGIVIFHFNRFLNLDGRWQGVDDAVKSFSLFVDLFFVLSGYIIAALYSQRMRGGADYGRFLQRRIARLGPLHWATLAVFILYWLGDAVGLLSDHDPQRYDPACIAPNLLLIQGWGTCRYLSFNFVSWSISAEFGMYLAFPLFLWIGRRGTGWLAALAGLALAVLMAVSLPPGPPRDFHQWTFDLGVLRALPAFLFGMIAWRLKSWMARIPHPQLILWSLFGLFLIGAMLRLDRTLLLFVVYALALAGIAADAAGPVGPVVRRLAPLGQLTYSLYMLHPIVLKAMLAHMGMGHLHLSGEAMRYWTIGWALALLPISYLSLMFFERPARDWINRLGSTKRVQPGGQIADRA